MTDSPRPVLEVRGLTTRFHTRSGIVHAVNGVSWTLHEGRSLALVGESGSGKTVSALSLLGLVPHPGRIEGGRVILNGRDLLDLSPKGWQGVRGREIAMVFQDPMTSLNPVLTVGRQLAEPMRRHLGMSRRAAADEAVALLARVGIPDARDRLGDHPHEFSGGQRQRIVIAMALACRPAVLVADEPTTALDVTIQAQILALIRELQAQLGMAILWITHDLALVAGLVDRVAVMYGGTIVEEADVDALYARPRHPYTRGLLASLPDPETGGRLKVIEGRPPDLVGAPTGCPFAPRCPWAADRCHAEVPPLRPVAAGHASACWRQGDVDAEPRSSASASTGDGRVPGRRDDVPTPDDPS
ncbi:MAG: ABC transporter ATP-binding protein [Gemmatimonadota bacterium]|jgi:oligopeptide/dipeptide ABC transporter ATP-binding protein